VSAPLQQLQRPPVLHPDDTQTLYRCQALAAHLCALIGVPDAVLEPKRRPLALSAVGLCYVQERRMSVTLRYRQHAEDGGRWWSKPLPWEEVRDTVAHECAHLRYRGHGAEFKALHARLAEAAERWDAAQGRAA
jgi:hypothetical protein